MKLNDYPLWTAVITPMNNNGSVNFTDLNLIIKEQEQANNALLILGSTGEALNLTEEEKKEILEYVISLRPQVPIMVGVGGSNIQDTVKWLEYLESLPIHSYLLVTPIYSKPGMEGQYHWFKTLLDKVTKPCMLYNVPSRTGIKMNFAAIEKLRDHPNFWAIKEASGSCDDFSNYHKISKDILIFSGDDALLPSFSVLGAKGLVSVASNVWPIETHLYVQMCLEDSLNDKDQKIWEEASNTLFMASNPIPVKALMTYKKTISTNTMKIPLHKDDLKNIEPLLLAQSKITKWHENLKG